MLCFKLCSGSFRAFSRNNFRAFSGSFGRLSGLNGSLGRLSGFSGFSGSLGRLSGSLGRFSRIFGRSSGGSLSGFYLRFVLGSGVVAVTGASCKSGKCEKYAKN